MLNWDDNLPDDVKHKWFKWLNDLRLINHVTIPRFIGANFTEKCNDICLHGFCDSSTKAYAAVCYIVFNVYGSHVSKIVAAKARVAPLKELSIPRLKLLGCLILAELITSVKNSLKQEFNITKLFCWSDSEISLHWVKGVNKERKQWIQNRLNKIRKFVSSDHWNFVPGYLNPADIPTRDINIQSFANNAVWWNGPNFLTMEELDWPVQHTFQDVNYFREVDLELKHKEIITNVATSKLLNIESDSIKPRIDIGNVIDISHYSDLNKLYYVTAVVCRFIYNIKI